MITRVYLAGGMKHPWADEVMILRPDIMFLDPRSWETPDPKIYTRRDLEAIQQATSVLACMGSDNPSGFGMSLEIGYAHALNKPIIFWDAMGKDWRSRYFDMARTVAAHVVYSAKEAAAKL